MKPVLVIQHAEVEKPGLISDELASAGYPIQPVLAFHGQSIPQNTEEFQGLVIMGGPMGIYERERYPYLRDELRLIQKTLEAQKPILGICLGSQLLAAALGAEVRRGKQKEIGWHQVSLTDEGQVDSVLGGLTGLKGPGVTDQPFMALHWHGDVFDVPRGAVTLAFSELTACQAFRFRENAYGFLFHMEMTAEILQGMIETFAGELSQEGIDGQKIIQAATEYLPTLQKAGRAVFARWAALLGNQ